jgi:uncharacterized membrane protein YuzA (DUF378 family)
MEIKEHTTPEKLELYSFYWSETRLVIAAGALFLGGIPPIQFLFPLPIFNPILNLCWIISGAVSGYLIWRWWNNEQKVFGGKDKIDLAAFFVNVVTGINLGLAGLLGQNIGMTIVANNRMIFFVAGLAYLWAAYHLWNRWNKFGKKIF